MHLPNDRIIPPVPNRLNYVLWIQDLVQACHLAERFNGSSSQSPVSGLDVGTGASAIYPLLCVTLEPLWKVTGTDIEMASIQHARENVARNQLGDRIRICAPVEEDERLFFEISNDAERTWTFTMCNPPFYTSVAAMKRSAGGKALPPRAVLTASANELLTTGGEVQFVARMVEESLVLQTRCCWYTSMLGHLSSLMELIGVLHKRNISNYAVTELVQGHTRRWVLAWSLDVVRLPDDIARISQPGIQSLLPPRNTLLHPLDLSQPYDQDELHALAAKVLQAVQGLEVLDLSKQLLSPSPAPHYITSVPPPHPFSGLLVAARVNMWSRAARRKAQISMTTDDMGGFDRSLSFVCRVYWADRMKKDEGLLNASTRGRQQLTQAVLGVDWVRGEDRAMFESFVSHIVKRVRTDLAPRDQT